MKKNKQNVDVLKNGEEVVRWSIEGKVTKKEKLSMRMPQNAS